MLPRKWRDTTPERHRIGALPRQWAGSGGGLATTDAAWRADRAAAHRCNREPDAARRPGRKPALSARPRRGYGQVLYAHRHGSYCGGGGAAV
nr:hypothetical protein [Tanacetum cinerariifolium]